jgi:hypothetical protein
MAGSSSGSGAQNDDVTPELVQKVVDRVYALWLKDLQIERERRQGFGSKRNGGKRL